MAQDVENSTFHELLMFLVLEARISSFYYTRIFENIKKKQGTPLEKKDKNIFRRILNLRNFEMLETLGVHFSNFWNLGILNFW